tara:strand:+ start:1016 stop:2992 length:1977 start_codon:yes stop_codon:yes gene_type:complete
MCAIFGFSSGRGLIDNEMFLIKKDIETFTNLSLKRGSDTFGVNINFENKNFVFKSNSNPQVSIKSKIYNKFINEKLDLLYKSKSSFNYFGQTRLVTNGTKFLYKNNQPIVTKKIIGLHNGIFFFKEDDEHNIDAKKNYESINVKSDSLTFFEKLNERVNKQKNSDLIHSYFDLINQVSGNYSIAFNYAPKNFIFISSNCGSLYFYFDKDKKIFVYSSEKFILKSFLNKSNFLNKNTSLSLENNINQVKNNLIIFDNITNEIIKLNNKSSTEKVNLNFAEYKNFETITNEQENITKFNSLQRCKKCVLPQTYPFIKFDKGGVCNYCHNYKPQIFLGEGKLIQILNKYKKKNNKQDCLVGLSGGRDSCYALHLLKTKLGMNPIAFTYDWGLTTDISRLNASKLCGKLGVEHIIRSADIEKKRKYVRQNIFAWLKNPHLGMLPIVQAGDKGFMDFGRILCKELNLGICIQGTGYQLEQREFFLGFAGIEQKLRDNQKMSSYSLSTKLKMFFWYSYQCIKNPSYLNKALLDNFNGFLASFIRKENFLHLYNYIKWDEDLMRNTLIEDYGWLSDKSYGLNQWRMGDGQTAFNNFIYFNIAGFSEYDNFRSNEIREGIITRNEALKLVKEDNKPRYETLKNFSEIIGFNLDVVLSKISSIDKLY